MSTLVKDKIYNFRTNNERLEAAKAFLEAQGRDLPSVLNAVIDQIVLTKTVPVKTKEDIEAEAFLAELEGTLNSRLDSMLAGDYLKESELWEHLGV